MATDLISVFLRTEPFSLRFPYVFGVLEFFFDTEYYAILMSNYFTLAHFRTFARLLRFLPFCLPLKLTIGSASNKLQTIGTASRHCNTLRLQLDVPSRIIRQFISKKIHAKKTTTTITTIKTIQIYRCNALLPARSIPSVNHTSCVESIVFLSTNKKKLN